MFSSKSFLFPANLDPSKFRIPFIHARRTKEELDERSKFEEKELPMPPNTILQHMNHFNLISANQIRTALNNNHTFYNHSDKDIDWINPTIYSLVREYESGNMKRTHSEMWFQTHMAND